MTELLLATMASAILSASDGHGSVAFRYGPIDEKALAWYSRFDVLVTHDPLPREQVERLHAAGTKLVLYEWSVAFYGSLASPWQKSLIGTPALLNEKPLRGGAGAEDADAWYFDPADEKTSERRAAEIAKKLSAIGYDGVFLDTLSFESVHPRAKKIYAERHPELPYDEAFASFLRTLRSQLGMRIIFTNQAYRTADHFLPYSDFDLVESYVTHPKNGRSVARRWWDEKDPWNSTRFIIEKLVEPEQVRFPKVKFVHLNYIDRHDAQLIDLTVATSLLFDARGYAAAGDPQQERSESYFLSVGKAVSPIQHANGGRASFRFFERGLVVVNDSGERLVVPACGRSYDLGEHSGVEPLEGSLVFERNANGPRAWILGSIGAGGAPAVRGR